jgi:hypothetical protein
MNRSAGVLKPERTAFILFLLLEVGSRRMIILQLNKASWEEKAIGQSVLEVAFQR